MCESILILEKNDVTSTELHEIMLSIKLKLTSRLNDNFFGSKVSSALKNFSRRQQNTFTNEAREVYKRASTYIEKYYDYENSIFKYFNALNIRIIDLKYDDILKVASLLNIKINEDRLYDEINIIGQYVTELRKDSNCSSTEKIWVAIFNAVNNLNEIKKNSLQDNVHSS